MTLAAPSVRAWRRWHALPIHSAASLLIHVQLPGPYRYPFRATETRFVISGMQLVQGTRPGPDADIPEQAKA
jgi:hypothetical protein